MNIWFMPSVALITPTLLTRIIGPWSNSTTARAQRVERLQREVAVDKDLGGIWRRAAAPDSGAHAPDRCGKRKSSGEVLLNAHRAWRPISFKWGFLLAQTFRKKGPRGRLRVRLIGRLGARSLFHHGDFPSSGAGEVVSTGTARFKASNAWPHLFFFCRTSLLAAWWSCRQSSASWP